MLQTKKTLNEQVNEILNAKASKGMKREALIKLNLTEADVNQLLSMIPSARSSSERISLTFGVEIECSRCNRISLINTANSRGLEVHSEGYNHTDNTRYIKIVSDGSLVGTDTNEVVTPVLSGSKGKSTLKKLCESFDEIGAEVNRSCGLHIHIGCTKMTDEWYISVFKNYQMCKNVIDSFLAPSRRGDNARWCAGISQYDYDACHTIEDVREMMNYDRYHCVNAESYSRHHTIEFRQHQGTTKYTKIAHWLQFLQELVKWSKKNRLQEAVTSIDEIPFISQAMKDYLKARKEQLN